MAIHTEYSVRTNSAYAPTTRRSALLPASAPKAPRRPRLATVSHRIARRRHVSRAPIGPIPHVAPRVITVVMGSVCGIRTQLEMAEWLLLAASRLAAANPSRPALAFRLRLGGSVRRKPRPQRR